MDKDINYEIQDTFNNDTIEEMLDSEDSEVKVSKEEESDENEN